MEPDGCESGREPTTAQGVPGADDPDLGKLSFIVKIWLEETANDAGQAAWRGRVTHVPSGQRRYIGDLDDIAGFIADYLEQMNARFALWWRMKRWLKRRRRSLRTKS